MLAISESVTEKELQQEIQNLIEINNIKKISQTEIIYSKLIKSQFYFWKK